MVTARAAMLCGPVTGIALVSMRVLLTNDDGIEADGLLALRRALLEIEHVELQVVAPDGNRSAMARSITTRRPLTVREYDFGDGGVGYATDGTPVDCVRLAQLGLIPDFSAQLIVAGINHGANLGDDVTYSGTVAAALEGIMLGLPAVAVSQQSQTRDLDHRAGRTWDFATAAAFTARVVEQIADLGLEPGTLLNINVPGDEPDGVAVARLGKRIYGDVLRFLDEGADGRRYDIYGEAIGLDEQSPDGEIITDLAAIVAGQIAVTPMHFELTDIAGIDTLGRSDLSALLGPAARGVAES
jgi:5'-nucleotidase